MISGRSFLGEPLAEPRHELEALDGAPRVGLVEQLLGAELRALVAVEGDAAVARHLRRDRGQAPDLRGEPGWEAAGFASQQLGERLVSLVLFGSVARRQAQPSSDIDLVVVAEGLPFSLLDRRRPLLESWERERSAAGHPFISWNLVTKSVEEARHHSPLYLDMTADGILLFDRDGFFATILEAMRRRMTELGSRRIFLSDGSWYWDLKRDFRFGEVVEI